ncbi:MFS transporter [Actinoplanes capillaceus]|uniref:MFS transporter n=1 Tax=Actinoplanes campanulatus TaxID=113559 RepID=A0ABQ3WQS8_9ACTN|nr:MFS transporter [Actinoplanes capillaceus]GID48620.1 MFS transporter [Actinoplanes capillaceus]
MRTGFVAAFTIAHFGLWVSLLAPIIITLQLRVQVLAPGHEAGVLSLVLAVGAILGLLVNPVVGRLSDRTVSRFGMRRPWLVAGALLAFAGALVMALVPTVPGLIGGWALAQIGFNTTLAVLLALLPDHVAAERRGLVSGLLGLGQGLAAVVAAGIAGSVAHASLTAGFLIPAVIGLTCGLGVVFVLHDRRLSPGERPAWSLAEIARAYTFSPRRHPDFGWALLSRFAIFMATAAVLNYQLFFLVARLGLDSGAAAGVVAAGTGAQTACVIVASGTSGWLSDRLRRRRVFVVASALSCAAGLLVLATATALPGYFAAMILLGLGQGVYFSVDLALITDVLPDREHDAAKDLGVVNVANLLPQSLAPAVAPLLLALGGYPALFVAGAAWAVISAVSVLPIRGTR